MTENEIGELTKQYFKLENEILTKISNMPSYGKDCDCNEPSRFCVVNDDNMAVCYCLNCGGNL